MLPPRANQMSIPLSGIQEMRGQYVSTIKLVIPISYMRILVLGLFVEPTLKGFPAAHPETIGISRSNWPTTASRSFHRVIWCKDP